MNFCKSLVFEEGESRPTENRNVSKFRNAFLSKLHQPSSHLIELDGRHNRPRGRHGGDGLQARHYCCRPRVHGRDACVGVRVGRDGWRAGCIGRAHLGVRFSAVGCYQGGASMRNLGHRINKVSLPQTASNSWACFAYNLQT